MDSTSCWNGTRTGDSLVRLHPARFGQWYDIIQIGTTSDSTADRFPPAGPQDASKPEYVYQGGPWVLSTPSRHPGRSRSDELKKRVASGLLSRGRRFFLPLVALRNRRPGYAVNMIKAGVRLVGHGEVAGERAGRGPASRSLGSPENDPDIT